MPSHATASRAAFCRSSLTKPDFYLSRWSNSKIGYPYLPAHDPGRGVPAAGGPARVACRPLAPAFVRHLPARVVQAAPAAGVRGSLLPGSSAGPGSSTAWSPARPRQATAPPKSSVVLVPPDLRLHCPQRGPASRPPCLSRQTFASTALPGSAWPCQGRPPCLSASCFCYGSVPTRQGNTARALPTQPTTSWFGRRAWSTSTRFVV